MLNKCITFSNSKIIVCNSRDFNSDQSNRDYDYFLHIRAAVLVAGFELDRMACVHHAGDGYKLFFRHGVFVNR